MIDMGAIVQSRQLPDQTHAADGPPAHVLDQPIADFGLGGDHHRSAGKLAVIKRQEETRAPVDASLLVHANRKWTPPEPGERQENRRLITNLTPPTKAPRPQSCYVGRKTHTHEIDVVQHA